MNNINIWPNLTLTFTAFNLLGWWFKGKPFFSFWWLILIWLFDIILICGMSKILDQYEKIEILKRK